MKRFFIRYTSVSLFVLVLFTSCSVEKTYKNELWEITLHSVKYQDDYEYKYYDTTSSSFRTATLEGLVVRLSIKYLGPDGAAPLPEIVLQKAAGGDSINPGLTLIVGGFSGDAVENGVHVQMVGKDPENGITYVAKIDRVFMVPNDNSKYLLKIGNIKPIELHP